MNTVVEGIEGRFVETTFPVLLRHSVESRGDLSIKVTHTHEKAIMRLVVDFRNLNIGPQPYSAQQFVLAVKHGTKMQFPNTGANKTATAVFDPLDWKITYTWPQPDDRPEFILSTETVYVAHHAEGIGLMVNAGMEKTVRIINSGPFYLDLGHCLLGKPAEHFYKNEDLMEDPDQHDMTIDEFIYIYSLPPTERGDNLASCLKVAGEVPNQLFAFQGVFYSIGEIWRHPEAAAAIRALVPEDTVELMKLSQENDLK